MCVCVREREREREREEQTEKDREKFRDCCGMCVLCVCYVCACVLRVCELCVCVSAAAGVDHRSLGGLMYKQFVPTGPHFFSCVYFCQCLDQAPPDRSDIHSASVFSLGFGAYEGPSNVQCRHVRIWCLQITTGS